MKIFFLIITSLFVLSCKNDEKKEVEKKVFIVSTFNKEIENHRKNTLLKNPELEIINEFNSDDYSKGEINFIFTNDNKIYYHYDNIIQLLCTNQSVEAPINKKNLLSDSLKEIKFENIYPLLENVINQPRLKDNWKNTKPISFSFESDTIKNHDIYTLLENIDNLGYHAYTVRRIAPFEIKAIEEKR